MPPGLILSVAAGLAAVMAAVWVAQRATGNAGWVDVVWSFGAGLAGITLSLAPTVRGTEPSARQILIALLVALWSLRLGLHLARRVAGGPEDPRYANLRESFGRHVQLLMFAFFQLQALCALLLALAIALAARNPAPGLRSLDVAGIALLAIAILGAAVADHQLRRFKAAPQNRGRICDLGLWAWSRHPNYFFEWLGWLAYPLLAIDPGGGYPQGWLALLGPAFMYALLVYVSGIPPTERHMLRSRGDAFRAYQRRTNAFWPSPPRSEAVSERCD